MERRLFARRDFLKLSSPTATALLLAACATIQLSGMKTWVRPRHSALGSSAASDL